ncbi:SURF1 family protein [Roseateles oligotrophus]|uniref:SURF1-like protein n=1 Tax=Roseateles oligotrophus TaxID=1769250 RepID=A0ABT2YE71_9BURK|nr:SURF1 family protein [Roseateles oligotrophus]MCV2368290.1 SURF1 family protein [Roseateles oligotrophus]
MKLSVRAVALLFGTIFSLALTFSLGFWQLDRAKQKEALQAAVVANGERPPLQSAELSGVVGKDELAKAQLHRRVLLRGSWLSERTVFLDNRAMGGRTGFFVLTPLQLEGRSEVVLVQRGWSPRDALDRTRLQSVPTPTGLVTVSGRLIAAPSKVYEFAAAPLGTIRQNLDLQAFAQEIDKPILPVTVLQLATARSDGQAVADGLLREWQPPDSGLHKHYGYAFQWFLLSALILGLYVWFQTKRIRKQAKPS